ncbi:MULTISPECIES: nickel insertion protein [Methanobacterium]|jgi:uncharacterized protein (DUF111 family)|uniref:DUF111 family protein n=1 Tax=Methanobacterium formicicum TaxID=2162 RepID=A0A089ZDE0_METFO|nr:MULTISPECIES: nickel insertion protein [Methanobacterium]AIS30845.1 hypothetical protein BRM9_0011 [Methanobacterium formicicum]KUK72555.1 MAG: Uncharacterized protein XD90_1818 [Methanobacterium sp. 42_16]MBF4474975.1 DUF111 family protein [Methanobacterium formicicum]MDD4811524.1 DUF111 family protein [Methanobacterium formicicum]MDG3547046.1 DUF111 family protein [Methanobacterium formicicum]
MLLMITVDDLPTEGLPYIIERTMERGAKNIHVLNGITKKGRVEYIFLVEVSKKSLEDISKFLALELGTLGMKIFHTDHIKLPFEIISRKVVVETENTQLEIEVQVKYLKNDNDQVISLKAEYEDIKKIALKLESRGISIPLAKLKTVIEAEAYKKVLDNDNIRIKVN